MAQPAKTTASTTVPDSAQGGGFPPFNTSTYVSQLLWLALIFAVLYAFMARFVVPSIGGIIADRAMRISSDLDDAAAMKAKAEEAGAAYEKALSDARAKAQSLAQDTRDKAASASDTRRKSLEAKLSARIIKAEADISAMKTKAMGNVSGIASDAAADIVQLLTGVAPAKAVLADAIKTVMKV